MTAEMTPIKQIHPFVAALSEIVGTRNKGREVQVATKSLRDLELGIIHDPRLGEGKMMLILQEKGSQHQGVARQTVRVELYANRFKVIPYVSRNHIEDELRMQLEYIDLQNAQEAIDIGQRYDEDEIDDIALRWNLAG